MKNQITKNLLSALAAGAILTSAHAADSPEIRKTLALEGASDVELFGEMRRHKDNF